MTAVKRLKKALQEFQVEEGIVAQIFQGYETISDRSKKEKRAAFFLQAIERMEGLLDRELCHDIRDVCACSKGGWRLKAMQKIARECDGQSVEQKLQAIGQVTHMGSPVLNEDGMITAQIGDVGGFQCPCPVFDGVVLEQTVSKTYCYCCAGHFRHHYQIALGKRLQTRDVVSSALASHRKEPCRFVFEILE
jgi:hypothetical protein